MIFSKYCKWIDDKYDIKSVNGILWFTIKDEYKDDAHYRIPSFSIIPSDYGMILSFKRPENCDSLAFEVEVVEMLLDNDKLRQYIVHALNEDIADILSLDLPILKMKNNQFITDNRDNYVFATSTEIGAIIVLIDKKKANKYKIEKIEEFKIVNKF